MVEGSGSVSVSGCGSSSDSGSGSGSGNCHYHRDLYADDTQLSDHQSISSVAESIANIENCVSDVNKWCA